MKILTILAHPDDEILWGWPVMQLPGKKYLVTIASNNERYGKNAIEAAKEFCIQNNTAFYRSLFTDTNFYRLPLRSDIAPTLVDMKEYIDRFLLAVLRSLKPDIVFTHNPFGEYGHGDHKLVFDLVCRQSYISKIWFTDICLWNKSHISSENIPAYIWNAFYKDAKVGDKSILDDKWFEANKKIYTDRKAWSWNNPIAKECKIYEIQT